MNSTAYFNPDGVISPSNNEPTWQTEIAELHRNHILIELLLCRPTTLPTEAVRQYRHIRQVLIQTIEQFLTDMDELEQKKLLHRPQARNVLTKHTIIMRGLNRLVADLLNEPSPVAQA